METSQSPTVTIDTRGTRCPRPILALADAAARADAAGTVVHLLADDPNARVDVPVWCRLRGRELVDAGEHDGVWTFAVELVPAAGG